jgi:hypothetical protein
MSHPQDLPLAPIPEPPLPGQEQPAAQAAAASSTTRWNSPAEVVMHLDAEQLRELEANDEFKLLPPELKPAQVLAQMENRQQAKPVPQPVNPFLDVSPRVVGEKTLEDEATRREPWQFSLQEMMWASVVVLVGVAFTRLVLSHPAFLTLGIVAWCGIFVLGRLHFRDPERVDWLAVQAIGLTYASILWVGLTF